MLLGNVCSSSLYRLKNNMAPVQSDVCIQSVNNAHSNFHVTPVR